MIFVEIVISQQVNVEGTDVESYPVIDIKDYFVGESPVEFRPIVEVVVPPQVVVHEICEVRNPLDGAKLEVVIPPQVVIQEICGIQGPPGPSAAVAFEVHDLIAGQDLISLRIVGLGPDGKLYYASSDDIYWARNVVGMTLESVYAGEKVKVRMFGFVEEKSWSFDVSKGIYLGLQGRVVQDIDRNSMRFVLSLGKVYTFDKLYLNIASQEAILLS